MFGKTNIGTESHEQQKFFFGVEDFSTLKTSVDLLVIGRVFGTVAVGDTVNIVNLGDDDNKIVRSKITGIEKSNSPTPSATDSIIALKVEFGAELNIKIGSVIYYGDVSDKELHDAYVQALGDAYFNLRKMEYSEKDYETMTATDLAEVRRMFSVMMYKNKDIESTENAEKNKATFQTLTIELSKKIINLDEIFVLINKNTGKPHLFSQIFKTEDGKMITSPACIYIITKASHENQNFPFDENNFEFKSVINGENKDGIRLYLQKCFYKYGADGASILFTDISIPSGRFVDKPEKIEFNNQNYNQFGEPSLEKWFTLMEQLGKNPSEEEKKIYMIYVANIFRELASKKLLAPCKYDSGNDIPKYGTTKGKNKKPAVCLYTSWDRFKKSCPPHVNIDTTLVGVSNVIDEFDVIINNGYLYIDKDVYVKNIRKFE